MQVNRSAAVGTKKVLMADQRIPLTSSLFPSTRLFVRSFSIRNTQEQEISMSPTSILESKSSFSEKNFTKNSVKSTPSNGIADALIEEKNGRVLRGSQLKIQVSFSPIPIEFGIKTKDSLLSSGSLVHDRCSSPVILPGSMPKSGMELSEDYTCVISRGANPRMIHIFDDYVVESSGDDFLSVCRSCKTSLRHGVDIFIYRGEESFCCEECRNERIMSEERRRPSEL